MQESVKYLEDILIAFKLSNMKRRTHSRIQNIQFKYLLSSFSLDLTGAFIAPCESADACLYVLRMLRYIEC